MRASKYTVKPTSQFKKDYKLAMKRGLDISLLEDIIANWRWENPCQKRTGITRSAEIGMATGNVTYYQIGY